MSNHIIFRLLSEEDRVALEEFNGEIEPTVMRIPIFKVDSRYNPFLALPEDKLLSRDTLSKLRDEAKKYKGTGSKRDYLNKIKDEKLGKIRASVFFTLNIYPSYFPITSGSELKKKDITVNDYLDVKAAWGGVRTTHGIHGFFTYDMDDTRRRIPDFYKDYGYWDGVHIRETGGNLKDEPKNIFINKFFAEDNSGNLSNGGNFDNLFYKYDIDGENVDVKYIECSGGQATYTKGDDKGNIEFGEDATCDDFEGVLDEDLLRYTRLGKLMPSLSLTEYSDRREEINFRGKGAMIGFHVKMPECSLSYEDLDDSDEIDYEAIVKNTEDMLENWRSDSKKKTLHKKFFGEIHNCVLEYFKDELENGIDSTSNLYELISDLRSEE